MTSADEVLVARAVELANSILDDEWRSEALKWLARGVERARTIHNDDELRSAAMVGIAERIVIADSAVEVLVARAVERANTISDDSSRSRALAGIALQMASANPTDEVLVARAVELANTIPDDGTRCAALAGIAGSSSSTTLFALATPWRRHGLSSVLAAASAYVAAAARLRRVYPATEAGLSDRQRDRRIRRSRLIARDGGLRKRSRGAVETPERSRSPGGLCPAFVVPPRP